MLCCVELCYVVLRCVVLSCLMLCFWVVPFPFLLYISREGYLSILCGTRTCHFSKHYGLMGTIFRRNIELWVSFSTSFIGIMGHILEKIFAIV